MPETILQIVKPTRLIDGLGGAAKDGMAVVLDKGRIRAVDRQSDLAVLETEAQVLEFPGATVLPGLVDCHTHTNMPGTGLSVDEVGEDGDDIHLLEGIKNARLVIESGVTTMRDNGGWNSVPFSLKEGIRRKIVPGPRIVASGNPITITGGHCWMMGAQADGMEAVRHEARRLIKNGADFIKVMTSGGGTRGTLSDRASYTLEELRALVDEAHLQGKLVGGHAIATQAIVNCLDAGVDMVIHCSFMQPDGSLTFDTDIGERLASSGVWVNPTLFVGKSGDLALEEKVRSGQISDSEQITQDENLTRMEVSRRMGEAGVRLIGGSDCGWSAYPFGRFHLELDAMVQTGMSTSQAVLAGTRDAAESLGLLDQIGTLERGKEADLLVLDGDPTQDINNLSNVVAVFQGGERVR